MQEVIGSTPIFSTFKVKVKVTKFYFFLPYAFLPYTIFDILKQAKL